MFESTDGVDRGQAAVRAHKGLTTEAVVAEAIGQLDRHGLAGLSMRKLAAALDVTAPTLYWHVRSREELLDLVADQLLVDVVAAPTFDLDWRAAARTQLHALWALSQEHRSFLELLGERPLYSAAGARLIEHLLLVLRHAGFPPAQAVQHARTFLWLAFGLMRGADSSRRRLEQHPDAPIELDEADPDRLLAPCLPYLHQLDPDAIFRETVELVVRATPDPPPPRRPRRPLSPGNARRRGAGGPPAARRARRG